MDMLTDVAGRMAFHRVASQVFSKVYKASKKVDGSNTCKQGKSAAERIRERVNCYSKKWVNSSLKRAITKFAPQSKGIKTSKGKTIYRNTKTGIQVVVDDVGNYFRIEDTRITGRRKYLDLNGIIPNNKKINGKISGNTKGEYQQATHFNNID